MIERDLEYVSKLKKKYVYTGLSLLFIQRKWNGHPDHRMRVIAHHTTQWIPCPIGYRYIYGRCRRISRLLFIYSYDNM